jgi:ATP-binding cassette, subfamily B, bacterial
MSSSEHPGAERADEHSDERADGRAGPAHGLGGPLDILRDTVALVVRFARWQRASSTISLVTSTVFAGTIILSAQAVGWVAERLILPGLTGEGEVRLSVGGAAAIILLVALTKSILIVVRRASAAWWQFRTEQRLRRDMVRHQLDLSLRWYASRGVGDLLSVSGTDTKESASLIAPLPFAVGVVFLLIGSMAVILRVDVALGLMAGLIFLTVVTIDALGSWFAFLHMERVQRHHGDVARVAHESFDGLLTVRALGREDDESVRLADAAEQLRDALIVLGRAGTGIRTLTDLIPTLGTIAILWVATGRVVAGVLSPGELVTVAYLLSLLVVPTRMIGYLVWDAAGSLAGWRRVAGVLDVEDRVTYGTATLTPPGGGTGTSASGLEVRVEGVTLRFEDGRRALDGVDLALPAGRTVAIVGPTGSGKSTLARMLARLAEPDDGRVLLDGVDVRELGRGELPAHVAYVPQEPFLFDDTLGRNIDLGDEHVSAADVARAVRLANLDDDVAELTDGLDARIGERGTTLSGGQRQRVGLARALARRPRLLVLDDATSAIDAAVEADILEGLRDAELGATVVIVAARTSTIALADEVVHLVAGRVADRGTHTELLARSPAYAQLVEAYARDAEERRVSGDTPTVQQ